MYVIFFTKIKSNKRGWRSPTVIGLRLSSLEDKTVYFTAQSDMSKQALWLALYKWASRSYPRIGREVVQYRRWKQLFLLTRKSRSYGKLEIFPTKLFLSLVVCTWNHVYSKVEILRRYCNMPHICHVRQVIGLVILHLLSLSGIVLGLIEMCV